MPPEEISFDRYLDLIFASSNRTDACLSMLSAFLENIDACRDSLSQSLPEAAPSVVDQVEALAARARQFEANLRAEAERHGAEFKTSELGAVLWWAGMASHKAISSATSSRTKMAANDWDSAWFEVHALLFDTMSALSLLSVAENVLHRMELEGLGHVRGN
jgi:hypothetical protein